MFLNEKEVFYNTENVFELNPSEKANIVLAT